MNSLKWTRDACATHGDGVRTAFRLFGACGFPEAAANFWFVPGARVRGLYLAEPSTLNTNEMTSSARSLLSQQIIDLRQRHLPARHMRIGGSDPRTWLGICPQLSRFVFDLE